MKIVLVGSGASAVHFAQSVLEKGHEVLMLDVGRARPEPVNPEDDFEELKSRLDDPVRHLLGETFEAVTYPGAADEYYGFPPNKSYVFEGVDSFRVRSSGFSPLSSFAQGGLAEAWTGGVFPFNEGELADFPFSFDDLAPYYDVVAERIGVAGVEDDLAAHIPVHRHLLPPLELDEHSRLLLTTYESRRDWFRKELGCSIGRSRIATLSREKDERAACSYLGRCLLGCPSEALYTPLVTLRKCLASRRFEYRGGLLVTHFRFDGTRGIHTVVAEPVNGGEPEEIPVEKLVLGAGTLSSTKIFLESWARATGDSPRLTGLMDNRQILVPFVNRRMLRRAHDPKTYQYHQLTVGLESRDPRDYVHGLVTTLKTASIHPIVQSVPLDLASALHVFRNAHAALGLVNINFADHRRETSWVEIVRRSRDASSVLHVNYEPPPGERRRLRLAQRRFSRALRALGCFVPPGMSHVRPMGASVHYAGTLPMSAQELPFTSTPQGKSRDFENLYFVDGTTFPFLPAKNLTFTLMANAARIADRAF